MIETTTGASVTNENLEVLFEIPQFKPFMLPPGVFLVSNSTINISSNMGDVGISYWSHAHFPWQKKKKQADYHNLIPCAEFEN